MRVWPILNLVRMTSPHLEFLLAVDQALDVFLILRSSLECWFSVKCSTFLGLGSGNGFCSLCRVNGI